LNRPRHPLVVLLLVVAAATSTRAAAVHNIHLWTDTSPDLTSREDLVSTLTAPWPDDQDKALAIFRWMVRSHRQTHATREDGRPLFDPIRFYNSYANTYCGYMAGYLTTLVEGLGPDWRHRYVELGDHTVAEVSWDAGATWHLLDTSMVVYVLKPDGTLASVDEIAAAGSSALSLALGETGPVPGHLYLYHTANTCMSNPVNPALTALDDPWGYRRASDQPVPYIRTLRNGADSYAPPNEFQTAFTHVRHGVRYRLNLREGDVYTRYWARLGDTPEYYRPAGTADPNATSPSADFHGTGVWEQAPDLSSIDYRRSIHDETGLVHASEAGGGPLLQPAAAAVTGRLVLKVDAANVVTSGTLFLIGERATGDMVRALVSTDAGIGWTEVWSAPVGAFDAAVPLSPTLVGGALEYLVAVEMTAADPSACGLDAVRIETITQLNAFTLPRLQLGPNVVAFDVGEQAPALTLWPVIHDDGVPGYEHTAESWSDVTARVDPDAFSRAIVRPTTANVPGRVTWRLDAPTPIVRVDYGGSLFVMQGMPDDRVRLLHAFDDDPYALDLDHAYDGTTWDVRRYVSATPPGVRRTVRLRHELLGAVDADWNSPGLQDVLMTVVHEPRDPQTGPVEVTWNWTEFHDGAESVRSHTWIASPERQAWRINVGGDRDPRMNWVRLRLADGGSTGGYSAGDPGPGALRDKRVVRFDWLDDLSRGAPYTLSRPANGVDPDEGGELTNGAIVPPTTFSSHYIVDDMTAFWAPGAPVSATVDLGSVRTVAGVRVSTHQPNPDYAHPARIVAEISSDGSNWTPIGEALHDQVWHPEGDFLDWGFVQSNAYADWPAGGPFWVLPAAPASGRWLRVTCELQDGLGLGWSEIQAFSAVTVDDWPDREIAVPAAPTAVPDDDGLPRPHDRPTLRCAPNPFNPLTRIAFDAPTAGRAVLAVHDARGRALRTLRAGWLEAGAHQVVWDGRDDAGRRLPSGAYFIRFESAGRTAVAKVLLIK
jgi:hypothetical protein